MTKIFDTLLICGWCKNEFKTKIFKNEDEERTLLQCPHCGRLLPSSKKILTGNLVGAKHIHIEWKDGDVVI